MTEAINNTCEELFDALEGNEKELNDCKSFLNYCGMYLSTFRQYQSLKSVYDSLKNCKDTELKLEHRMAISFLYNSRTDVDIQSNISNYKKAIKKKRKELQTKDISFIYPAKVEKLRNEIEELKEYIKREQDTGPRYFMREVFGSLSKLEKDLEVDDNYGETSRKKIAYYDTAKKYIIDGYKIWCKLENRADINHISEDEIEKEAKDIYNLVKGISHIEDIAKTYCENQDKKEVTYKEAFECILSPELREQIINFARSKKSGILFYTTPFRRQLTCDGTYDIKTYNWAFSERVSYGYPKMETKIEEYKHKLDKYKDSLETINKKITPYIARIVSLC